MSVGVRPQPWRLDPGKLGTLEDLQKTLPEIITSADTMFQYLFEDMKRLDDSVGSGLLTVPSGGTGVATFTPFSVICGGTTSTAPLQSVVGLGTSGQLLTSNGPGLLPTWQPAPSPSAASVGAVPYASTRKSVWVQRIDDNLTTSSTVGTPNTFAAFGTVTNLIDTTSTWWRTTTTTGLNNSAGQRNSTLDAGLFSHKPTLVIQIRTDSTITGIRYWFGLFDNTGQTTNPGTSTTGVNTGKHCAFRYVDGTDTGWVGSSADGATQNTTANVNAIATSTVYTLKIRFSSNLTANFSVNGGTEVALTLASNAADTTAMTFAMYVFNNTGAAGTHRVDISAMYMEYN